MNCSEVQDLLSAYFDGELAGDQDSGVAEHVRECLDCARELKGFERLATGARTLNAPSPPARIWQQLEKQLDDEEATPPAGRRRRMPSPKFVLAATVLVAATISWFAFQGWFSAHETESFTIAFGQYLDEFRRNPDAAQRRLLAMYEGQPIDPRQAVQSIGYRPAVADGLPDGYRAQATYVMTMPCCKCVQTICTREDGSTLAIFERDHGTTSEWFGDRPGITTSCNGKPCQMVELGDRIAASWTRGGRNITLIGVRDVAEVSQMMAWMDNSRNLGGKD